MTRTLRQLDALPTLEGYEVGTRFKIMSTQANAFISDPSNAAPIANSPDWRTAVVDLLTAWIAAGRCFSSGEVASALRVHRTDLRFSVPNLGEYLRDCFYGGTLPTYPDVDDGYGNMVPLAVTMSPRTTVGLYPDRTPAGIQVFVYGPEVGACDAHEFEVFIPNPAAGETMASAPTPAKGTPAPARGSQAGGKGPVTIGGSKTPAGDIEATVWPDSRIGIPRSAFEVAVHLAGTPIKGGDPVFVTCTATEATVTLADVAGSTRYDLWTTGGRIAFANPAKPFVPGAKFKLDITAGKIVVKL